jgi:hypothetical protein
VRAQAGRGVNILLIHPEGNANYNPNLLGLLELLGEAGHRITYVAPKRPFDQQPTAPGVSVKLLEHPEAHGLFVFPEVRKLRLPRARPDFARWRGYDLVLAIDRGIIEGSWIARHYGIAHALLSYEIFFREETSARYKAPEVEACRGLAFAVCQDALRTRHLCLQNGIAAANVLQVPAAGRGFRAATPKPRLLHERFRLPAPTKTVLHMGSFAEWTRAPFLLESTRHWTEDWVLVIHDRYGASPATRKLVRKHAQPERVRLSEAAFADAGAMSGFVQSADLGVALYRPDYRNAWIGRNIEHIGLASGKISTYLQHGVPVATHELGEISGLIREHGAGQVFSLEQPFVPEATALGRREACRQLFEGHLDLDRFAGPFLEAVAKAGSQPARAAHPGA